MSGGRVERRLAAVLAADVAGYSRLMGADELGTLEALRAHRCEVIDPAIARHRGRIVKTTGDGMLVEFASAVDAVTCAMSVQEKMAERNGSFTPAITFRIGINIGDIIVDGDDIFGDGVNVAARVENECEPGSVCLSGGAYEQVRGKTPFIFDDLGERALKNIDRPVRLFAARSASAAPAGSLKPAAKTGLLALPDKPSIAVLPFQNMSGDPEQEYFADGVVEDIITALSHVKSFFVIARNSSFTYKSKHVDIRQVGRELGVRYVLEGSIRRAGNRIRITGQLIEAATGSHVWADKFEGGLEDIFDLQDTITETVVSAIEPSLTSAEIRRSSSKPTDSLDAYDLYLRALPRWYTQTREGLDEALQLLNRAIALDPDYAFAKAIAASIQCTRTAQTWSTPEEMAAGAQLAREALISGRDEPATIAFAAHALGWLGRDYDTALAAAERALHMNPNSFQITFRSAWIKAWVSDADGAIAGFLRAIRLSPIDPEIGFSLGGLAYCFLMKGEYDKGLDYARRTTRSMPRWRPGWTALAVAAVKTGRAQEAEEAARSILQLAPNFTITRGIRAAGYRDQWVRDLLIDGMRKSGLPE